MESIISSRRGKHGQSVITVLPLKLNYDAETKHGPNISSKVDAIRRDLPPESEIPCNSKFSLPDSQQAFVLFKFHFGHYCSLNEVTDYLVD